MATINLGRVVGDQGVGIKSVVKTATTGLVDTYTITLTDNSTTAFTVTNGAAGEPGDAGDPGQNATINGVNTLTIQEGANITITQEGNVITIAAAGGGSSVEVVQSTGQSTTAVMSQKAATDAINEAVSSASLAVLDKTQAEYDALTEAEKLNGTLYVIVEG